MTDPGVVMVDYLGLLLAEDKPSAAVALARECRALAMDDVDRLLLLGMSRRVLFALRVPGRPMFTQAQMETLARVNLTLSELAMWDRDGWPTWAQLEMLSGLRGG